MKCDEGTLWLFDGCTVQGPNLKQLSSAIELFYFLSQKYISNILFIQVRFYDQLFFWPRFEEKRRIVISLTDTGEDSSQNNEDKNAFENGKTFDIAYNNQDIDNPRRSFSIINAESSLSLLALPVLLGFQLF
jgi:hypothetical protein